MTACPECGAVIDGGEREYPAAKIVACPSCGKKMYWQLDDSWTPVQ
jgi:endogenous inhibitor of DNA gyrase (YacG/DUF329 family)